MIPPSDGQLGDSFSSENSRIWINFSSNAFFLLHQKNIYICNLEEVSYQNTFSRVLTLGDKDYIPNKYILVFKISTLANPEQAFSLYFFFFKYLEDIELL